MDRRTEQTGLFSYRLDIPILAAFLPPRTEKSFIVIAGEEERWPVGALLGQSFGRDL